MKSAKIIKPLQSRNNTNALKSKESRPNIFSFNRSLRFPLQKENDDPQYPTLPSTLDKKTCSFGFGKRWEPKSRHCQDAPCPTTYSLRSIFGQPSNTIDYKKQTVKERQLFYIKPVPGPGSYNPRTPNRKHSPNSFIIGRKHLRTNSQTPSPGDYTPNFDLKCKASSINISFTKAKRNELHSSIESSPGPGMYNIRPLLLENNSNQIKKKIQRSKSEGKIFYNNLHN